MLEFRSSWRHPLFWCLLGILLFGIAGTSEFSRDITFKYRDLYDILTRGDLSELEKPRVLKELVKLILYTSAAISIIFFFLSRFGKSVYRWLCYRYTVTPEKVIAVHGLIAKDYREGFLPYMRNVHIRQTLLDRLLFTGDLTLSSGGADNLIVYMHKIGSPFALKDRLMTTIPTYPSPTAPPSPPPPQKPLTTPPTKPTKKKTPATPAPELLLKPSFLETKLYTEDTNNKTDDDDGATQITRIVR